MENQPSLVLVVDDQNSNLQLIGEILDREGLQVMPSLNGEQALARAQLRPPDLVLLDMAMPGMGGVQTCRELHRLPGLETLPILFVTGANDRASMVKAFEAGAVDFITKPFLAEELLARVRAHLDLKRARDQLASMVQDREDVIDIVAHDVKNPLACVLFAAQTLKRTEAAKASARVMELSEEIEGCAHDALSYIKQFLSRGMRDERLRQFGSASISLRDVALEAIRLQRAAAEFHGVHLTAVGDVPAWADAFAVRNVILNLLSNAIRHSPQGSEIVIELAPSGRAGHSLCMVRDNGPGLSDDARETLFQRKAPRPAEPNVEANPYSNGLGLAIAKRDVTQMGGNLWYQPGKTRGSIFTIELPQSASYGLASSSK